MSGAVLGKSIAAPVPDEGRLPTAHPTSTAARLRVLEIVESSAGGTGRHVLDLVHGLAERGCDVHLIYSSRRIDGLFLDRLESLANVHLTALPMRTSIHPADCAAVRAIRRYVRANGPFDIIHGHSSKGGAFARLAGIGSGARIFYTAHGLTTMDPQLARGKRALYLAIERFLSIATSSIIAVAPEEARAIVASGLVGPRLVTIPNGVGAIRCTPRQDARQALGLNDHHMAVGFVGRLVEQKAPHVLIEAFAAVAAQLPHARLVMVGDGPLRAQMDSLAQKLGVQHQILWLGERDAREVLAAVDVFAISSCKEGLPYVVLEAMAIGLPIVATASAGVESLVQPAVNGFVVDRDDASAFGQSLLKLATDDALRRSMGLESLRLVKGFSVDAMVDATLAAYLQQTHA